MLAPAAAIAGTSAYDDAVGDFIEVLEGHMSNCERLGRYAEADIARQRLMELKEYELFRRRETLRSRQLAEVLGVEEAHVLQFTEFHAAWDAKTAAFEERAAGQLAELQARHEEELRTYQQKLLVRSAYPRHSKEYFNMRKIEEYLAKNKNYVEAAALREKADELAAWEEQRWNAERQADLLAKEANLKAKLRTELEGVKNRLTSNRAELARARRRDLEMLLTRYANAKSEVERGHKLERLKFDKEMALELKLIRAQAHKLAY